MACTNISIKKEPTSKQVLLIGAGGFRTHVQTKDSITFYMFIIMFFRKRIGEMLPTLLLILYVSRLFSQEINKSILNLLCLMIKVSGRPLKRQKHI